MAQPCDEWAQLLNGAEAAGRWAARELARSYPMRYLSRPGEIEIYIEPADSPVAAWLYGRRIGRLTGNCHGVLLPIIVRPDDLLPAQDAQTKADSLLVRHAYAVAYCSVLADEAGVATEIRITTDPDANRSRLPLQPNSQQAETRATSSRRTG